VIWDAGPGFEQNPVYVFPEVAPVTTMLAVGAYTIPRHRVLSDLGCDADEDGRGTASTERLEPPELAHHAAAVAVGAPALPIPSACSDATSAVSSGVVLGERDPISACGTRHR